MSKKLVLSTCLGIAVLAVVWFLTPPGPPVAGYPNPNGYDDFVRAGAMFGSRLALPDDPDTQELLSTVAKNGDALRLARAGLQKDCRVPLPTVSMNFSNAIVRHGAEISTFKSLARGFIAEGRLAERENHYSDAARIYLDTIRFGQESCRGGLVIDLLVGLVWQSLGCQALEKLCNRLPSEDCRKTIRDLEKIASRTEPADEVIRSEHKWSRENFGWRERIAALMTWKSLRTFERKIVAKFQAQQSANQLLLIHLASRAYELEKGQPPKAIADLTADYLKTIPRDPITKEPMVRLPEPKEQGQGVGP